MSLILTLVSLWASWKDDAALAELDLHVPATFTTSSAAAYKFSLGIPSSFSLWYVAINFCVCVCICWSDKCTAGKDVCSLWNLLRINKKWVKTEKVNTTIKYKSSRQDTFNHLVVLKYLHFISSLHFYHHAKTINFKTYSAEVK